MGLNHLTNDKALKTLLGPMAEIGDGKVYLAEQPFITIQGEGPNIGKNTLFIRFFGCNLANSCGVDWCDSAHSFYTKDEIKEGEFAAKPDRVTFASVDAFYNHMFVMNDLGNFNNIVFTGGEPMLWQVTIAKLLQLLRDKYHRTITVEIETNGTIPVEVELVDWFKMVHFNISPKVHVCKKFPLISQVSGRSDIDGVPFNHNDWVLKFVWEGQKTIPLVEKVCEEYGVDKSNVYLMPEGISRDEQVSKMQELAEYCINHGYNFSARLHVLVWNLAKGI